MTHCAGRVAGFARPRARVLAAARSAMRFLPFHRLFHSIELTLLGAVGFTTPDDVARAAEQGATRLLLGTLEGDLGRMKDDLSRTADALIHREPLT